MVTKNIISQINRNRANTEYSVEKALVSLQGL